MAFDLFNEKLKPLFDYTSDGVVILDGALNIIALNGSAAEITGWNPAERVGKRFPVETLIPLESGEESGKGPLLLRGGETRREFQMEVRLRDGQRVSLPALLFPIGNEKEARYFGLILENILSRYGVGENLIRKERLDQATGLLQKDYFLEVAGGEIKMMNRSGGNLGAILVRIDNFQEIHERAGKMKVQEIVKNVGEVVKGNSREIDLVSRYAEGEFMVLLINSDSSKMKNILSRLKTKLIQYHRTAPVPIRVSAGQAILNQEYEKIFSKVKEALENFL